LTTTKYRITVYSSEAVMTLQDTVKLVDGSARFCKWADVVNGQQAGWVKGNGWETKICGNEDNAWAAAEEMLLASVAA
jgi:hypothetical protein